MPNTAGSTVMAPTAFTLPSARAVGSNLDVRWVDDNAVQTSPDQITGLNNVGVNVVPEPSTGTALLLGLGVLAAAGSRRTARA